MDRRKEIYRKIIQILKKEGAKRIEVFGSYAKGRGEDR